MLESQTDKRHVPNWAGQDLPPDAGRIELSNDCLNEIVALADDLASNPLVTEALVSGDFELPACRDMMQAAKAEIDDGVGFALIDRLPIEDMGRHTATQIYWILASMISRPVAQNWKGVLLYGVADVTKKKPGNGIRPDVTSAEQNFHTDNSYNTVTPDYVGLFCLQTAKSGGISRIVNFETAIERLKLQDPVLVDRLHSDFLFDRQREHAPDDCKWIENPVFARDGQGRLRSRLSVYLIQQGYELAGRTMDEQGSAALNALAQIIDDPALYKEFFFEPGQIQIVDNRRIGHKRTAFEDWPEPERQRHLVRIWLRDGGRRFYHG